MNADSVLRKQLLDLLNSNNAHMTFEEAVDRFPLDFANRKPPAVDYTPWHLLEHIRITQNDILDFIRNPNYVWLNWPDDYWPPRTEEADRARWDKTIAGFLADRKALEGIVSDASVDLTAELAHAPGYTILREIIVAADHNAYHIGEFGILREVMGTWRRNDEPLAADMSQFPPFL